VRRVRAGPVAEAVKTAVERVRPAVERLTLTWNAEVERRWPWVDAATPLEKTLLEMCEA